MSCHAMPYHDTPCSRPAHAAARQLQAQQKTPDHCVRLYGALLLYTPSEARKAGKADATRRQLFSKEPSGIYIRTAQNIIEEKQASDVPAYCTGRTAPKTGVAGHGYLSLTFNTVPASSKYRSSSLNIYIFQHSIV